MKEAVISIRNVSMRFPGKRAGEEIAVLENVNADVARGEFVCIVGPSGCGKSTLLNIVAGFLITDRMLKMFKKKETPGK